jgi:hypothetical protein
MCNRQQNHGNRQQGIPHADQAQNRQHERHHTQERYSWRFIHIDFPERHDSLVPQKKTITTTPNRQTSPAT